MDISQFSKCLKELIEDNDKVGVPHLGTFIAEYAPASFSDRRTIINPPTRVMSFVKEDISPSSNNIFIKKMVESLGIDEQQAPIELGWCLSRIISELEGARSCTLPGLGKMKANARREYFFIPDENLDIYPEGTGLDSISIKSTEEKVQKPQPRKEVKPAKESKPLGTLPKVVIALVLTVVILLVMLYLLRDNAGVSAFLDKILYSEEELQLLGR